jgi:hypothetical protein
MAFENTFNFILPLLSTALKGGSYFYSIVIPHLMQNLFVPCHSALDAESVYSFLHFIKTATPIPTFPRGKEFSSSSSNSSSSSLAYPKSFPKERTAISFIMAFRVDSSSSSSSNSSSIYRFFPCPKGWKLLLFNCHSAVERNRMLLSPSDLHPNTHPNLPSREGVLLLFSSSSSNSSSSSLNYPTICSGMCNSFCRLFN